MAKKFMVIEVRDTRGAEKDQIGMNIISAESTADAVKALEDAWALAPYTLSRVSGMWIVPMKEALTLPIVNWKRKYCGKS